MTTRLAINGLGRIGRALVRVLAERDDLDVELVAANDRAPVEQLVRLLARDSVHGRFPGCVAVDDEGLVVDGRAVRVFAAERPADIPWDETPAEVVVEATGAIEDREAASAHLRGAVGRVIVSANLETADFTVCLGVNHGTLDPDLHRVISNSSCTTNCMAPVAMVLDHAFGLERGLLTTVHAYTRGQELLDGPHEDPRRGRAAALNIVPTATGAARAVGLVLPHLAGRLDAQAVRVPTPNVSLVQFVVQIAAEPSLEEIADALRRAADGALRGILAVSDEPLVSTDVIGCPVSALIDLDLLQRLDGGMVRVVAWYDNEWGYANRLAELAALIGAAAR